MAEKTDALYETFGFVLGLSRPGARLAQLGLSVADIAAIRARHREEKSPATVRPSAGGIHDAAARAGWYPGSADSDRYWATVLESVRRTGYSESACQSLDEASTRVVAELRHPREPSFSTRGMVLTHRQAGVTGHIAAVIAKAADAGYRLFVVLVSPREALRQQVQRRLSEQLVQPHPSTWTELTSVEQDFRARRLEPARALGPDSGSLLCVVKKNVRILRDLDFWLGQAASVLHEVPTLVIDMDSNQPPVASGTVAAPLQAILQKLPRAGYLGYTDTPIAGALLDPEADYLFPRDFIVTLPAPAMYAGPERLFGDPSDGGEAGTGDDGCDMIRIISPGELPELRPASRAAVEDFEAVLPASLSRAVEHFWMVAAARRVRSRGATNNTMVIHTSPFRAVQESYVLPLQELRDRTLQRLETLPDTAHLRTAWQEEIDRVPPEDFGEAAVSFEELSVHLPAVLRDSEILVGSAGENLDYSAGPVTAIIMAGASWPRGLTIEGLSVGYFAPSGAVYSAVQQMDLWCGFRPGYADLARIWMTEELAEWWRQITDAQAELRRQLERAEREAESPSTLALHLRTHPALRVVRAAKQRQPLVGVSYGGTRVESHRFRTDIGWLTNNLESARGLVTASAFEASKVTGSPETGRYVFFDVSSSSILDFLARYEFLGDESGMPTARLLADYIRKRIRVAESLRRWNVAVLGRQVGAAGDCLTFADGVTVGRVVRSRFEYAVTSGGVADIKVLMARRDAAADLSGGHELDTPQAIKEARRAQLPNTGLLALYPIDRTSPPAAAGRWRAPMNAEEHVIGVGLVFPEPVRSDSVVYWPGP